MVRCLFILILSTLPQCGAYQLRGTRLALLHFILVYIQTCLGSGLTTSFIPFILIVRNTRNM